jgi:hypothetical protein
MEKTRRIGRRYIAVHGALMLCLGLAMCILASVMTRSGFAEFGYAVAVVLSSSCLLLVWICFGALVIAERRHCPITNYVLIGLLSIVCWFFFGFVSSALTDLRALTLLAGIHGVVWSLWYARLALYMDVFPRKAALLSILAATTAFLGIALATVPEITQISAVAGAAYYAMFIGIQILLTVVYLYREFEAGAPLPRLSSYERSEVRISGNSSESEVISIIPRRQEIKETSTSVTYN